MKGFFKYTWIIMLGIFVSGMIFSCSKDDDNGDGGVIDQSNQNSNIWANKPDAMRLEVPALRRSSGSYFIVHYAQMNNSNSTKVFNYCLEFDSVNTHSRWVAFCFNDTTKVKNVGRSNEPFDADLMIPSACRIGGTAYSGTGYTRGHLCASADRLFSTEANEQTFYMSNMSPQEYNFNSYYWAQLETLIRDWASSSKFKKLYVCKGGTINSWQQLGQFTTSNINGKTVKVTIPKFYFMAILGETPNKTYQSIGFWVEHKNYGGNYPRMEVMQNHAMSIDELEEKTGIDFFCNLNDKLENAVERTYSPNAWKGLQ